MSHNIVNVKKKFGFTSHVYIYDHFYIPHSIYRDFPNLTYRSKFTQNVSEFDFSPFPLLNFKDIGFQFKK